MTDSADSDVLYGPQTRAAIANFGASGEQMPAALIRALAAIKAAAAVVNAQKADGFDHTVAEAVRDAADEVAAGIHDDQFPIDVFQTGSGTSTNMNVNEVVATLATQQLGRDVHPNDHVNASQSTNDTFPSALRIACLQALHDELLPALATLERELGLKSREYGSIIKRAALTTWTQPRSCSETSSEVIRLRSQGCSDAYGRYSPNWEGCPWAARRPATA